MEAWKKVKLGDLVTFKRGHDLPESEVKEGLYPIFGSAGFSGFHNAFTTKGNAITVGRSGSSVGKSFFSEGDFWAHNT